MLPERGAIKPEVGGRVQADGLRFALQDVVANRLCQTVQGAAQARAALAPIALGPEHGRERVAAVRLIIHCEVDQQRQRFAQVQVRRLAVALHAWLAENE